MYYRIAVRARSSPTWRWVSGPLGSMTAVMRWLMYYQAVPRGRLRVFQSSTPDGLCVQLARENDGLPSQSVQAAALVAIQNDNPHPTPVPTTPATVSELPQSAACAQMRSPARTLQEIGRNPLDRRRDEVERGAGGDRDIPYRFSVPISALELLAWVRLLVRVERGDLRGECWSDDCHIATSTAALASVRHR